MLPRLRKDIKQAAACTLRLGQDGATLAAPPFPAQGPGNLSDAPKRILKTQLVAAEATSTETPGPMVELIETFCM